MLTITIFSIIFACASASPIEPRIIGGRLASPGQFPYQVSLRNSENNAHSCGASIISSQWLLTAASCVQRLLSTNVIAVVGTNQLNSSGIAYGITTIVSHVGYNPATHANNIAVLRTSGNIVFNNRIKTIGLANRTLPGGSNVILSGWGYTNSSSTVLSNDLQYLSLQSITVAQCQERLPEYAVEGTNLCTTSPAGQGACRGDGGGPLTYNNGVQIRQVGIFSWGIPCATGSPDVYTSVAAYRSWIRTNTGGV